MRFDFLTSNEHRMYKKAMELYCISFPPHEQREPVSQAKILNDNEYRFSLIYDKDIFVGIVLYWETMNFIYVEHFCILPEMRNKKYGQKVLELLEEQRKTVILEIDPPIDTISIHRKSFYERSGFVENPYPHIHPPYHKGNTGHHLMIMSYPAQITQAQYNAFRHYLEYHVMEDVFS